MNRDGKTTTVIILVILFAVGAFHWVWFLNYGDMSFKPHDWSKEFIYYSVLSRAISSGTMPYHIPVAFQGSNRFLALPEVNLSPQIFLLPLMSVGTFVVLNTVLLYSAGFVGSLLIKRRYNLSLVSFAVFFLLFNFNGHIVAHLGVGHSMWAGYFLLPFFLLFLLELIEGAPWRLGAIKIALVLFAMSLQGSFHLLIWCVLLLILILAFNWRKLGKPMLAAVLLGGVLSAYRLGPALFALWGKKEKFIWSYPTPLDLLDALATIRDQTPERLRPWGTAGWWEHDLYIGLIGLAVIVIFGLYLRFSRKPDFATHRYAELDLPMVAMTLLSLSYFHAFITRIPVPILKSERVAMRFAIIPLVLLVLISSIRMETVLRGIKRGFKYGFLAAATLVLLALSFLDHSYLWSIGRLDRQFAQKTVDLTIPPIQSQPDSFYKASVVASMAVSAVAVAALVYLGARYRSREKRT
jgi:hypothetical protein